MQQRVVIEQQKSGGCCFYGCLAMVGLLLLMVVGGYLFSRSEAGKQLFDLGQQIADTIQILGKWRQHDGNLTLEFLPDGILREERPLNAARGTYKLLPNRRMLLKIDGIFWGQNEITVRYELAGDELTLTPDAGVGLALRYRRAN